MGIPIGAQYKSLSLWNPIKDRMKSKLSAWKRRHLSFGGRLILLKSVLSSFLLFYLSFFKIPKVISLSITKIQRAFLWGGGMEQRKIHWVRWSTVCKPKESGGLGVRDLEIFNISLLGKWKWRMVNEPNALWVKVLEARYGEVSLVSDTIVRGGSSWWNNIIKASKSGKREKREWFQEGIRRIIGDRKETYFWKQPWCERTALKDTYQRLFSVSEQKNELIADMGNWVGGYWTWNFRWRKNLFEWEEDSLRIMLSSINNIIMQQQQQDKWRWILHPSSSYTVSSTYLHLSQERQAEETTFFRTFWTSLAPLKTSCLGGRILNNGIATKTNLEKEASFIKNNKRGAFFATSKQNPLTIFFTCSASYLLWQLCYNWFGIQTVLPEQGKQHFTNHIGLWKKKKTTKIWNTIWFIMIWNIWKWRNDWIFNNKKGRYK
uniref:Ribonuclease H protein At1g65750 family n=1 Tax=Cajanus cajan TaxID=3821 RepID=A0A151RPY7_CAJCA|nr:Putative ribonuclease H protein At1g65750 family [Cajanus cajan]